VRILVVAEHYPWPAVDGIRQRLDHVVRGLARAGEVELLAVDRRDADERAATVAPDVPGLVDVVAIEARPDASVREWLPGWVRGGPPRRLANADWSQVAAAFRRRAAATDRPPIDLIWFSHVDSWWPVRDVDHGAASIVDYYDLIDLALRLRRRTSPQFAPGASAAAKVSTVGRWAMSRGFDLVDERRWTAVQRACAAHADVVTVCSELDRRRLALPDVEVIGNGSEMPEHIHADRTVLRGDAPVFLFVGALDYEPNADAVEWFVRSVLPKVRALVPDARLRIVGRGGERVAWVGGQPGVELVGRVPDIADELAATDVSIVPIRVGAGTRLKVVEALANRLPLVTTAVGCEGIDVVDGEHALIRDDERGFAAACVEAARDGELRQRLADAGAELFAERYDWDIIERHVAELAIRVVRRAGGGDPPGGQGRSRSTAGE
jgi:glycosyltransferase involved in cell wall biosynthesis